LLYSYIYDLLKAVKKCEDSNMPNLILRVVLCECESLSLTLREEHNLFKIYLERLLRDWKRKCQPMGIPIQNTYVHSPNFADDQVLLAQGHDDMEYMTKKLKEEYEKWELTINLEKKKLSMFLWVKENKF
jgi:hypothetical protein